MQTDRYHGQHSATTTSLVDAFEHASLEFFAHRPGTGAALDAILVQDPLHIRALVLMGFGHVLLARGDHVAPARLMAARARHALGTRNATDGERALVAALGKAARGRWLQSADILQDWLARSPRDLLAIKIAHALRFLSGDLRGLLAVTTGVIGSWSRQTEGYGFLLGCHAFAMEENGFYRQAEGAARLAVETESRDSWAIHALSHVQVMENRRHQGLAWLTQTRPTWSGCNNFRLHLSWHEALLHLGGGDAARALAIYDSDLRPWLNDDFRDNANAVSLLWRLRQEGIDTGGRFAELKQFADVRARDTTLAFSSLHHLLTMVACGDAAGASDIVRALSHRARRAGDDQAAVVNHVALELARVIASLVCGGVSRHDLASLARRISRIGGSNEQRDVFLRTLALMAADAGDRTGAGAVLTFRARMKRESAFAALVSRCLEEATARGPILVVA